LAGVKPERAYVDCGYYDRSVEGIDLYINGQRQDVTAQIKWELKRNSAVEPEIGHMK